MQLKNTSDSLVGHLFSIALPNTLLNPSQLLPELAITSRQSPDIVSIACFLHAIGSNFLFASKTPSEANRQSWMHSNSLESVPLVSFESQVVIVLLVKGNT
uniref:Odorant-binding protein 29 n=1 Tax=Adelphocoris lineolatus TaxID=236346 RepID=A0A346RVI3_ADELI|nr:odorant-binding protein 29 [Adelphocoris lineolatus]